MRPGTNTNKPYLPLHRRQDSRSIQTLLQTWQGWLTISRYLTASQIRERRVFPTTSYEQSKILTLDCFKKLEPSGVYTVNICYPIPNDYVVGFYAISCTN